MSTTAARLPSKEAALERAVHRRRVGLEHWLGPDYRLGFLFVLPIVVLVLALVAYPFCYAVYLSLTRKYVGMPPCSSAWRTTSGSPSTASSGARWRTASSSRGRRWP